MGEDALGAGGHQHAPSNPSRAGSASVSKDRGQQREPNHHSLTSPCSPQQRRSQSGTLAGSSTEQESQSAAHAFRMSGVLRDENDNDADASLRDVPGTQV